MQAAPDASDDRRGRTNNFGVLRLLFAALVIVSHSPELIEGNRSRELLTRVFGTMSFGEVAVDGFCLVSGYLITMSFARSRSTFSYFEKRIGRIVPGYLAAFLICSFVIAPMVGGSEPLASHLKHAASQAARLLPPYVPGAFAGLPYEALNGAMWTIAYEFRCYVVVAILGLIAPYLPHRRALLLAGVVLCLALSAVGRLSLLHLPVGETVLGSPYISIRFFAAFGVGSLFYLFRDCVTFTKSGCIVATLVLLPAMFSHHLAERAFLLCGGYLIFAAALSAPTPRLFAWTNRTDISYGLYLYAWPAQNLLIWNDRTISPLLLCSLTLVIAGLAGFASWILIERPILTVVQRSERLRIQNATIAISAP